MSLIAVSTQAELRHERSEGDQRSLLGFWLYIMTDCVLFASLFASYAVLHNNTFGGPSGATLFDSHAVLAETLCLLTSSFTCGLAMLAARRRSKGQTMGWLAVTFLLGVAFLILELVEFHHLAATGNSWRRSGLLSAFFSLVGTHGLHITVGLTWMAAMGFKIRQRGFTRATMRRLAMFSMFWHFLDIVWIFIFTVVYMMGVA
jgi:cytochrome o ubiquinol oxidase subunit 3